MESHSNAVLGNPTFNGLAITSEQPRSLTGVNSGFFPSEVSLIACIVFSPCNFYLVIFDSELFLYPSLASLMLFLLELELLTLLANLINVET